MYENGHYFLLTDFTNACHILNYCVRPAVCERQHLLPLFSLRLILFFHCLNSIFRRKKKIQPKNSSGPKHSLGHYAKRDLKNLAAAFFESVCRNESISI